MSGTPLQGRIAVITGASRGLGSATAIKLAQAGAHCVLIGRDVDGLERTDDAIQTIGGKATLLPMNLRDMDSIDKLGPTLYERFGRCDILIGNAAILGDMTPLGHMTPKIWDEVLQVNLTANWRLIRTLDPLLRQSDAGRAVFVTSGVAQRAPAYWGPYAVSKAGLEMLANLYAAETVNSNLRVNLLDPGVMRTHMRAAAFPGENPETLESPEHSAEAIVGLCLPNLSEHGARIRS